MSADQTAINRLWEVYEQLSRAGSCGSLKSWQRNRAYDLATQVYTAIQELNGQTYGDMLKYLSQTEPARVG